MTVPPGVCERHGRLVQRAAIREADKIETAQSEACRWCLPDRGQSGAEHRAPAQVFAVLVIHVMRRVERAQRLEWPMRVRRPARLVERPANKNGAIPS
jgi:hypothetical protein